MASQPYDDSYSLFQQSSDDWDAPFTGKYPGPYPQSPQDTETEQSHHNPSSSSYLQSSDESSYEPSSYPSANTTDENSNSHGNKQIRKHRSKTWQLHKVKNERTLLQTNELLEQMINLEKSLESKPINSKSATKKKTKITYSNKSNGPISMHERRNDHTRLSDGIIIPRPKKDLLIQKLEDMEQNFLTEGVRKSPEECESLHSNDHTSLEKWKQSVKERARRNAVAALQRPRPSPTTKPGGCDASHSARPPTARIHGLKFQRTNLEDDRTKKTSLESYTLPSPKSITSSPPPTEANHTMKLQRTNTVDDQARRTSLESYMLSTEAANRINPSPRSISLQPRSRVVETTSTRNATVQSRPPSVPSKVTKPNEIIKRKQEQREDGETNLSNDHLRDQDGARMVQGRSSVQQSQDGPQEKTEQKNARRITTFRRSLVPLYHQKISEQGLKTIQDARQRRLQLLQQRKHDAQMAYLTEQRKRLVKLSGSPA